MASLSHSGISPAISSSSPPPVRLRSEEHTSELQSQSNLVCRLLLEKKKNLPVLPVRELTVDPHSGGPGAVPLSCGVYASRPPGVRRARLPDAPDSARRRDKPLEHSH